MKFLNGNPDNSKKLCQIPPGRLAGTSLAACSSGPPGQIKFWNLPRVRGRLLRSGDARAVQCPVLLSTERRPQASVSESEGKPVASNYGLLSTNSGLFWSIGAYHFVLLEDLAFQANGIGTGSGNRGTKPRAAPEPTSSEALLHESTKT